MRYAFLTLFLIPINVVAQTITSAQQKALNYYASIFGVRAILWHQGESDNYAQFSQSTAKSNLEYVINKSRTTLGSNISWVVSKASVFDKSGLGNAKQDIINAQNAVINDINNTKIFTF